MKTTVLSLVIALLSVGLMSGIFFTWSNAVKPGIGQLNDTGYLEALQAMNKAILNPPFYGFFFTAVIAIPLASFLNYKAAPSYVFKLLMMAAIVYFMGVFLVTLLGNIPLNNILEKTKLTTINEVEAKQLRKLIEPQWNQYNLIRSISSFISFCILIFSILKLK